MSTTLHNTWGLYMLGQKLNTFLNKECEVQSLLSLKYIEIGNASLLTIIQTGIFLKKNISLLLQISQKRRRQECIFMMDWEISIGVWGPVIIRFGILIELAYYKLLSVVFHCFYIWYLLQCTFSILYVRFSLFEFQRVDLNSEVGLIMVDRFWTALLTYTFILFLFLSAIQIIS